MLHLSRKILRFNRVPPISRSFYSIEQNKVNTDRFFMLEKMQSLVKTVSASQLYLFLEERIPAHNIRSLESESSKQRNITSPDNRAQIIEVATNTCITEGLRRSNGDENSIHHDLLCDIIEVLDLYKPSICQMGYLSLIDACVENKLQKEATEVFIRSQKIDVYIDNPTIERLLTLQAKEFEIQSILTTMARVKVITSNILIAIADPMIMSGNIDLYASFFSKFLFKSSSSSCDATSTDINSIIRAIVYARVKRVTSLSLLSDEEFSQMDNILNDINHYHNSLLESNSGYIYDTRTGNIEPSNIPSLWSYTLLCEVERLIRDRVDLSHTTFGKIILPFSSMSSEYLVEDRDMLYHHNVSIADITSYLQKEEKESSGKASLLMFDKSIWADRLSDMSASSSAYGNSMQFLQVLAELIHRLNRSQSIEVLGEGQEEDYSDLEVEDDEDDDDEEDDDDDDDDDEEEYNMDDDDDDDEDEEDDDDGEDIDEAIMSEIEEELTLDTQPLMSRLGRPPSPLPLDVEDLSQRLQQMSPPIHLGFADDIFRSDVSFTPAVAARGGSNNRRRSRVLPVPHSGGGSESGGGSGGDDNDGGGVSMTTPTVALESDKDDGP